MEGDWAWFVNGVVSGDGIFRSNHSMINLAPKTDKGFILYIPTSQLNEENTPSKGDLVFSNFWIAQRDIIVGNDGWFYPDGDITGSEYHLDTLGTLYFVDRSVDDSVLDTAAGDYLNATVKIFDYDESVNTYDNGYYFWNGGYGQGADFESVDGWGTELITDGNGDLVFGDPYEGGNTTWDAYHGYNREPNMSASLSENGYPVILDKTPDENGIESGEAVALDCLFDGTYQVGRTMLGGGGLFQQDADGYFYYDSLQNAAYFDGTDFTLYSNLIIRPWANAQDSRKEAYGNFLPLNELTKINITRDGYIFNDTSDTIVNSEHKPKGSLEAAGMSEVAALKILESSGNHRLPESLVTDDVCTTLFDESTRITARLQDKVNLWFGMTVEFEFYQPKGGVIDTDNDDVDDPEDMIFDFHGDDDVLVYIGTWDDETGDYDYRLVLDISGAHEARSGHINFRTGDVTYETDGTDGTTTVTTSLQNIFDLEGDTFADYSQMSIKFFYLERGGNISYCRLRFNMPTLPENSLTVTKELETTDNTELNRYILDAHSYDFRVVKTDENGNPTEEPLIPEGTSFVILQNGKELRRAGIVGENGVFSLLAGQSAQFSDLLTLTDRATVNYVVQEIMPTSLTGQYEDIFYTVDGAGGVAAGAGSGNFTSYSSPVMHGDSTQYVVFLNTVNTEKMGRLSITKAAAPLSNLEDNADYDMYVLLGNDYTSLTPIPVGTAYTINGTSYTVLQDGVIPLKVGQTAVLSDAILAGTQYLVYEDIPSSAEYMAIYSGQITVDGITEALTAQEAMSWAVAAEIMRGSGESGNLLLMPTNEITRAQAAAMLMRYCGTMEECE